MHKGCCLFLFAFVGHAPLPSAAAVNLAVRKNARSLRSAIGSERLQSLIPALYGSGLLHYNEYEHLDESRGHLPWTDVVEKVATAVEKWIKSHHARLDGVADLVKQFKSFRSVIVAIKNDFGQEL